MNTAIGKAAESYIYNLILKSDKNNPAWNSENKLFDLMSFSHETSFVIFPRLYLVCSFLYKTLPKLINKLYLLPIV